jgi:hypothetical protein
MCGNKLLRIGWQGEKGAENTILFLLPDGKVLYCQD